MLQVSGPYSVRAVPSSIFVTGWLYPLYGCLRQKFDLSLLIDTSCHWVITLLLIISLFLPYDKMRFFTPLCISLSGFFFLIIGVLIECFDEVIVGMMGVNFICAGVIFFIFFLGTEKHHRSYSNPSRPEADKSN